MPLSNEDDQQPQAAEGGPAQPAKSSVSDPSDVGPSNNSRQQGSLARDLDEVQRGRPERAFNVGVALGVLVTVAGAIFVLQNNRSTTFDWLWFDFELPLWTALLGAVGVGAVVVLTSLAVHARHRRRIGRRQAAAGRLRRALTGGRGTDGPANPRHQGDTAPSAPA